VGTVKGRILVVAGSDSGGGAGIQADIKTITALGGYAMTAITALTAQNTVGVQAVLPVPPGFVRLQMTSVLDDLGADAIKTGMLGDAATIEVLCDVIAARARDIPRVVDPVMVATTGRALLAEDAVAHFIRRLLPLASVLTPNLPEAEVLTGLAIADEAAMRVAAQALRDLGAEAVLLKGGHLQGDDVVDILATSSGVQAFRAPRIASRHTHGTGCTLASAVATGLAQGMALAHAVTRARAYVRAAIAGAPGYGAGHGPLNHAVTAHPDGLARPHRYRG
jgi:hydroxymethylpyrimidine/phosphomethylpyrimidine kinase